MWVEGSIKIIAIYMSHICLKTFGNPRTGIPWGGQSRVQFFCNSRDIQAAGAARRLHRNRQSTQQFSICHLPCTGWRDQAVTLPSSVGTHGRLQHTTCQVSPFLESSSWAVLAAARLPTLLIAHCGGLSWCCRRVLQRARMRVTGVPSNLEVKSVEADGRKVCLSGQIIVLGNDRGKISAVLLFTAD